MSNLQRNIYGHLGGIKDLKNSSSDKVTTARCYDQNKY